MESWLSPVVSGSQLQKEYARIRELLYDCIVLRFLHTELVPIRCPIAAFLHGQGGCCFLSID